MISVCGVQLAPRRGDRDANLRMVVRAIEEAASQGARLVVLPEASLTGYVFDDREAALAAAIDADGPELESVAEACRESRVGAVVGAIERDGKTLHNAVFLAGPQGLEGRYRKLHTLCLGVDRFTVPGSVPPISILPCEGVAVSSTPGWLSSGGGIQPTLTLPYVPSPYWELISTMAVSSAA